MKSTSVSIKSMKMHQILNFKDRTLLLNALTHRSYLHEHPGSGEHNERLEFLGDALLNFLSGEYLYRRYREKGEDELTRRRSALVDEQQLANFARKVGLSSKIRLGRGAKLEGGCENSKLLSGAFEALIAAYYFDKNRDIEAVRAVIKPLFDSVPETTFASRSNVDSKNRFQEWVQKNITPASPPKYDSKQIGGSCHEPEFLAKVFVGDRVYGEGRGGNKKDAEKAAAENALARLKQKLVESARSNKNLLP